MSRWYAMSTHFLTDEKVEVLGEQFGPAGPLVVIALLCRAKTQAQGGKVDGTFRDLAHQAYCQRDEVRTILEQARRVKLVEGDLNGIGYRLGFPAWEKWQSAFRQAQKRARDKRKPEKVTESHEPSRKVTNRTEQNKTEQQTRVVFQAWVEATDRDPKRTKLTTSRRGLIERRLRDYPVEDLVDAVRGIAASAFHRGENERGKRYDTLELCLRDAAHIEGFRDDARGQGKRDKAHPFV